MENDEDAEFDYEGERRQGSAWGDRGKGGGQCRSKGKLVSGFEEAGAHGSDDPDNDAMSAGHAQMNKGGGNEGKWGRKGGIQGFLNGWGSRGNSQGVWGNNGMQSGRGNDGGQGGWGDGQCGWAVGQQAKQRGGRKKNRYY